MRAKKRPTPIRIQPTRVAPTNHPGLRTRTKPAIDSSSSGITFLWLRVVDPLGIEPRCLMCLLVSLLAAYSRECWTHGADKLPPPLGFEVQEPSRGATAGLRNYNDPLHRRRNASGLLVSGSRMSFPPPRLNECVGCPDAYALGEEGAGDFIFRRREEGTERLDC